jgi:hypothetical protein
MPLTPETVVLLQVREQGGDVDKVGLLEQPLFAPLQLRDP